MSIKNLENPKYHWLRWIAFLPAAILSYLAVYVTLGTLSAVKSFVYPDIDNVLWGTALFQCTLASYAFIYGGNYTAPNHHKSVTVVLFTLLTIAVGISAVSLYNKFDLIYFCEALGLLLGGLIGFKKCYED